ncbi:b61 [miniopterid betaherpesvirus 1]|uniref:B61 n=1 Tax=miniopterid betaherpesvirus 1 TaxID=3070189 RepID=I3VQ50_9BETA|nr:b61 [miniopterid betaherpesvirus 1]AFK83894.1 b61 [miniopterid betaherpesvirus 1]
MPRTKDTADTDASTNASLCRSAFRFVDTCFRRRSDRSGAFLSMCLDAARSCVRRWKKAAARLLSGGV